MNYPKIDDDIYKEIENFEEYEYTNCIAYEMAIRNDVISKLYKKIIYSSESKLDIEELRLKYFIDYDEVLLYIGIEKDIDDDEVDSKFIYSDFLISNYIVNKKLKKAKIEMRNRFARPMLVLPSNFKTLIPEINLAFPESELIAYISKIKKEYNKENSIIKSPLALLDEELEKADEIKSKAIPKDKDKRKKAMAEAFYVYDMYKILEPEYAQNTKKLKFERDEKIKSIKENKYDYDSSQKKSMINDLKEYYDDELRKYDKNSIKIEIQKQSDLSLDKIEKYKALMNKYIDELKYKELITGITN